ncbi:MAG: HlyC/CorC family transporter [Pseudomonadota bacterium]
MILAILLTLTAIIALLASSAFFSGSETALTATSRSSMHALEKSGEKRATLVNELTQHRDRLIGAILIGNNLVNIFATALATSFLTFIFGAYGVAYATLVMTILVVIFSEILPKTYALYAPDRTALVVAPILKPIVIVFAPLGAIIQYCVRIILRSLGANIHNQDGLLSPHEEIRGAIDFHHQEGRVVKYDKDMLGGILDLRDLGVSDVMVHRTKMQTIDLDDPPEKIVENILKSPYTRLPLWREEPDNILGILHAKDLLRALRHAQWDVSKLDLLSLASDPWYIPETILLKDQLNAFLKRKAHFALVVDEYGEVMGLVTLEDILEEIVGEIVDEHDVDDKGIRPQADGTLNVDGAVPIRDLNRFMEWELPDDEATTIAGLVIHEAQTIPEPGQAFTFYGYRFEVLRRQRNKLTALRITPLDKSRAEKIAPKKI